MSFQANKNNGNDRYKVLDDLLNYIFETQRSENSEKYSLWKATIEGVIESI